jgi:hypothetical protein
MSPSVGGCGILLCTRETKKSNIHPNYLERYQRAQLESTYSGGFENAATCTTLPSISTLVHSS